MEESMNLKLIKYISFFGLAYILTPTNPCAKMPQPKAASRPNSSFPDDAKMAAELQKELDKESSRGNAQASRPKTNFEHKQKAEKTGANSLGKKGIAFKCLKISTNALG